MQEHRHYQRVARAIAYLQQHHAEQPDLQALAAHVHLSPAHLQRVFSEWAGVSPKKFLQFLTLEHARSLLVSGVTVDETAK
jgi:AraC family transcriptional regulator of adaptative response/methylated-DNA-[protein]-cysteine methyltransferase